MSAARILAAYRATFCTLIVVGSTQTLVARPAHDTLWLAAVEIAGALIFIWRRAELLGASLLLAVFACAQVISALEGSYPTRFLQYAASTALIVVLSRSPAGSRDVAR